MYVYWTANNIISVTQTLAMKTSGMKKLFNIPDIPKEQKKFSNKLNKEEFNPIKGFINVCIFKFYHGFGVSILQL